MTAKQAASAAYGEGVENAIWEAGSYVATQAAKAAGRDAYHVAWLRSHDRPEVPLGRTAVDVAEVAVVTVAEILAGSASG